MCLSPTYWSGVPGCLDLAPGSGGLAVGGGGLVIPGLLCSPVFSRGESGGWPGSGGWPEGVWLTDRESDTTGLRADPPMFAG